MCKFILAALLFLCSHFLFAFILVLPLSLSSLYPCLLFIPVFSLSLSSLYPCPLFVLSSFYPPFPCLSISSFIHWSLMREAVSLHGVSISYTHTPTHTYTHTHTHTHLLITMLHGVSVPYTHTPVK